MTTGTSTPNLINHFAALIDASWSMNVHADAVVQAWDNYVRFLAQLSQEQDQETRVTLYTFSGYGRQRCLFYDKDVLRLPSIQGLYKPGGNTALIDCAMLGVSDLEKTATLYGEHAFNLTLLSDGLENDSHDHGGRYEAPKRLAARIGGLPENWTTTAFGPNSYATVQLRACGFPEGNIAVWDTSSSAGMSQVGEVMRTSAASFMQGRKEGVHGWNKGAGSQRGGLFKVREFSAAEVKGAATPLTEGSYYFVEHPLSADRERIDALVTPYVVGRAYYEFTKAEDIQGGKAIAVETGGKVYSGPAARAVLGLPSDHTVHVRPNQQAGCTIFIQSTAYNRKILPGTRVLVLR
jgi:hypothetical protein